MKRVTKRIICVGNRYHPRDSAGGCVYDLLARMPIPEDVELVDGGLAGLDLLCFVEGAERVVFVDALEDEDLAAGVVVLPGAQAAATVSYDHQAGLGYLLRVLPHLCSDAIPEVFVVGVAGIPTPEASAQAAYTSLALARDGLSGWRSKVSLGAAGARG